MSEKLQYSFIAILTALTVPIMILNILGGVVSGIWLAILGEWGEIIRGIIFIVVSGFAISFALMPSLLFAGPAVMAIEKGKKTLGVFFGFLSVLYTVILITVWCVWIMWLFVSSATADSFIPLLIWSYGVALAPWMWLAQKDQQGGGGNEYSIFTTFFAQISYIIAMLMFFFGATFRTIATVFGTTMIIGGVLQMLFAFIIDKQNKALSYESQFPIGENQFNKSGGLRVCPNCSAKIEKDANFCTQCGREINSNS